METKTLAYAVAALALSGCATTYQMNLMPRDSGRIYTGTATDNGSGEGRVAVDIDGKAYSGTWVQLTPDRATGWISGGLGFGRGRFGFGGIGTTITSENPYGSESKALLSAQDGSGLRCDFRTGQGYGGGICRDARGRDYDVQLRSVRRG
jgi:hypothetical protein